MAHEDKVVDFRENGYTYVQEEKNVLKVAEENVAYGKRKEIRGGKKVKV